MNAAMVHRKYEVWILNIKQDIRVQKIKVKKCFLFIQKYFYIQCIQILLQRIETKIRLSYDISFDKIGW